MTESEAIAQLELDKHMIVFDPTTGNETPLSALSEEKLRAYEADRMAQRALREIQEYRATGHTPTMVNDLVRGYKEEHKRALEYAIKLDDYEAIGTPEECRAAMNMMRGFISVAESLIKLVEGVNMDAKGC